MRVLLAVRTSRVLSGKERRVGHVTAGDSSFGLVSFRRKDRLKEEKARERMRGRRRMCAC